MKKYGVLQMITTLMILLGITTTLYLYSAGYRLEKTEKNTVDLTRTGMVGAKSIPEGANVYLDGILLGATNDTISGVSPGIHHLKIVKKGFVPWEKDIEIFTELVTDITAVLVSQSPSLEPLTTYGAYQAKISPSLSKLAYFSNDETKPGVWVVSLGGNLGFFKSDTEVAVEDTRFIKYSKGKSIEWSPDEQSILIEGENGLYYLVNLSNKTAQTTSMPQKIKQEWNDKLTEKRTEFINKLDIPENIKQLAISTQATWSPDNKKFFYTVKNGNQIEYKVYNLEKPLPVGEKVETTFLTTNDYDRQPKIKWYSDSYHLILTEGDIEKNKKGTISLIRVDGTNKTEVYSNTLYSDEVFSSPGGEKLIISTSLKSDDKIDLYTVSIR